MNDTCKYAHTAKLHYVLLPEHKLLGKEWCEKFARMQLEEGYKNMMNDFSKQFDEDYKNT